MRLSRRQKHWTVRLAVALLLLGSAVPLLASAAAALQGRGVGEICSIYGVVLPAPDVPATGADAQHHAAHTHHHHADAHAAAGGTTDPSGDGEEGSKLHAGGGQHCVLSALAVLAGGGVPCADALAPQLAAAPSTWTDGEPGPDAVDRWAARLRHAPPARG
ncbi:hypothetical protein HQN59_13650 [Schlegelella sp. ID0723]|uniref:DUF2946 domain-containing protein n=2 Tax=Piscinibacter koreensis TaxID=2742824 RepID=A0A7Y6NPA5_9BURK|nr:hypothetical protein [Schlegelella koreensis]